MRSLSSTTPVRLPIRVIIADDSELARDSLRCLLSELQGIALVGEAIDGSGVVDLCLQLNPDIALLDIRMPVQDGLQITRALGKHIPGLRVILISMLAHPAFLVEALRAGARGYVLKGVTPDELDQALRCVVAGGLYLSPELVSQNLLQQIEHAGLPES